MDVPISVNALELSGLGRRYSLDYILRDISLNVAQGKLVALAGSNGAGKTTLLKLLATKLRPSRGQGKVFGFDLIKDAPEIRRHVAYVSVLGGHYGALSALENLRLAATLYGHDRHEVTVAELTGKLQAVGLLKAKDRPVREFSSGMKKRLGLARLLISDADLWLLDEPYAALDPEGQILIDEMLRTAKSQGRTVIMATHDIDHASQFADSVLELREGVLRKYGVFTDAEVARD